MLKRPSFIKDKTDVQIEKDIENGECSQKDVWDLFSYVIELESELEKANKTMNTLLYYD